MVFFVMVNDEFNFMQDVVDIEDYFIEVSLDESFGFNIIILCLIILVVRRFSVIIFLFLSGNGVNIFFRYCYCFR